jgi:hypothetical protein
MFQETRPYSLSAQQEQEFSNFQTLLTSWAGAFRYSLISYVAVRTAKGPRLIFGRVLLLPHRGGGNAAQFKFETKHIIAASFMSDVTMADIAQCLEKAKNSIIPAIDDPMTIELERGGSFFVYFDEIGSRFFPIAEGKRSPCLQMQGISIWALISNSLGSRPLERLDRELKAADKPFDNLDELLTHCGLPTHSQIGQTLFEIVASAPGWIGNGSTIKDGEASIECFVAAGLDIKKVKLGYGSLQKDSEERTSINGSALEWRHEGDVKIGTFRTHVGERPELQLFLSYGEFYLHQMRIWDPQKYLNPRYAIHQVFDKDLIRLEDILTNPENRKSFSSPKSNKAKEFAKEFEGAVSNLFYLLGFYIANYGRIPELQEGPDIIVISPAEDIGIIECTIGLLNKKNKLDKLVRRTTLIKEKLASAGYSHLEVQPAIATRLSRDEVAANLKIAEEHSIAVICKEEIRELLDRVKLPPESERIFEYIKGLVPSLNKDRAF